MIEETALSRLPGYELYKEGIDAIRAGDFHSAPALLVSMATSRLTRAGLPIPRFAHSGSAHLEFYALLANRYSNAHSKYNASLQRLDKFCRAVERLHPT